MTPELCPHCGEAIGGKKIWHERNILLETVMLTYLKHHLDDPGIGWDELDGRLLDTLCEVMGDKEFQEWVEKVTPKDNSKIGARLRRYINNQRIFYK